ncbi:MAG: hypothetical protein IKH67_03650 [Lachnospiraceae bacterium]|nr:hypothetical protein [Lachnospiraceae bacterium]MBR6350224.1 hypothetical protein [Lachnospiraceae bacterium]
MTVVSEEAKNAQGNWRHAEKRRRKKKRIILISAAVFIVLFTAGAILFQHFRTYTGYRVRETLEIANADENTIYKEFGRGYVKCGGDGITYFDKNGAVVWNESFEMSAPIIDVCGNYIAVADMKKNDIYIYDRSGYVNRITIGRSITDVEISEMGMAACATGESNANYIQLIDKDGNELITARSVFSASGYLMDITMSKDGTRLAAAFCFINSGAVRSKVVFYDFSREGTGDECIVGTFDQYENTVVTNVEFMGDKKVCAVGNDTLTFYNFSGEPSIIHEEKDETWQIQSLMLSDRYVGMVMEDTAGEYNYLLKAYNSSGREVMNVGVDYGYSHAILAGRNIMLYTNTNCHMYSFAGVHRMDYTFDDHIEVIASCGNGRDFILGTQTGTQLIRLK